MKKYSLFLLSVIFVTTLSCSKDSATNDNSTETDVNPVLKKELNDSLDYKPKSTTEQAYYGKIDFQLRGQKLKSALHHLVTETHRPLSYTPGIWEASKVTDEDPDNSNNVLLIYGWPDKDSKNDITKKRSLLKTESYTNDAQRFKKWEREHVFAKSLASPKLLTANNYTSPALNDLPYVAGHDAHNLRPINGEWNEVRSNFTFIDGKGNSGKIGYNWYPGDEWKGDVARMMMYMFLRYENQCRPDAIGVGSIVFYKGDRDGMIELFLKWNQEDPVSDIEIKRNEYHGNTKNTYAQGNRNPFIDNPYLANLIWGDNYGRVLTAESKWSKK